MCLASVCMRHLDYKQRRELTKLAVLTLLMEPLFQETGAGEATISRDVHSRLDTRNAYQNVKLLLPSMLEEGVIRREESEGKRKPYFITDTGKEYLHAAQQQALFPELAPQKDWSKGEGSPALLEDIAGTIRSLPEFRESDDQRIQQVSQQLAQIMGYTAAR